MNRRRQVWSAEGVTFKTFHCFHFYLTDIHATQALQLYIVTVFSWSGRYSLHGLIPGGEVSRSVYLPFNLVCLFARTRKNVCKQRDKERKRGSKHTLNDAGIVYCAQKCSGGSRDGGLLRMQRGHCTVNKPTSRLFSGSSMAARAPRTAQNSPLRRKTPSL